MGAVWLISFFWFVWLTGRTNEKNKTNQINQMNQRDKRRRARRGSSIWRRDGLQTRWQQKSSHGTQGRIRVRRVA